jgi:hypothetical protein
MTRALQMGPLGKATASSRGGSPSRWWRPSPGGPLPLGRPPSCGPVGPAHCLRLGLQTIGVLDSGFWPRPLGNSMASSRGGSSSRPGSPHRFGQSPLCRPVGLAHGLDRALLRRLGHFVLGLGTVSQTAGAQVRQLRALKSSRSRASVRHHSRPPSRDHSRRAACTALATIHVARPALGLPPFVSRGRHWACHRLRRAAGTALVTVRVVRQALHPSPFTSRGQHCAHHLHQRAAWVPQVKPVPAGVV